MSDQTEYYEYNYYFRPVHFTKSGWTMRYETYISFYSINRSGFISDLFNSNWLTFYHFKKKICS